MARDKSRLRSSCGAFSRPQFKRLRQRSDFFPLAEFLEPAIERGTLQRTTDSHRKSRAVDVERLAPEAAVTVLVYPLAADRGRRPACAAGQGGRRLSLLGATNGRASTPATWRSRTSPRSCGPTPTFARRSQRSRPRADTGSQSSPGIILLFGPAAVQPTPRACARPRAVLPAAGSLTLVVGAERHANPARDTPVPKVRILRGSVWGFGGRQARRTCQGRHRGPKSAP